VCSDNLVSSGYGAGSGQCLGAAAFASGTVACSDEDKLCSASLSAGWGEPCGVASLSFFPDALLGWCNWRLICVCALVMGMARSHRVVLGGCVMNKARCDPSRKMRECA